jgi:hypothetical protein
MLNRFTGATFYTRRPGDYYGTSNRCADGTPMYAPVPAYSGCHPKIDMYTVRGGDYLGSTNMFKTVREALHYFSIKGVKDIAPTFARIDRKPR